MRNLLFRFFSGILTAGLLWALLTQDHSKQSLRELAGLWVICVAFGAFSLFGTAAAEGVLGLFVGTPTPEPKDSDEDDPKLK